MFVKLLSVSFWYFFPIYLLFIFTYDALCDFVHHILMDSFVRFPIFDI